MKVLIKDNSIPIRTIQEINVPSTVQHKWIETLADSVSPGDVDLSGYKIRRICIDRDLVTIYVLSKEPTNGQD